MILETEMDYYTMMKRIETHTCGVCGGGLSAAWGGMWGIDQHVLRCVRDIDHETFTEIKQSPLAKAMVDTLKGRKTMDSKALMELDDKTMMQRIEQAKWPKALTAPEKTMIAAISVAYGLDPLLNEITLYQGQPYPTINARYRKAQESMLFDGIDSRPATNSEREERGAKEGDYLYRCEVWRKGSSHPFVGWGRVRVAEYKGKDSHLPIVNDPDRMAEKRAEMMAIKKAFSLPVPFTTWEEASEKIADAEYFEVPEVGKVEAKTGEIVEEEEVPEVAEPDENTSLEVPPESDAKDDTTVTPAQITRLKERLKKADVSVSQLATFCNHKSFGNEWGVTDMKDLRSWQFYEVTKAINDGILHSGV